ncbi:MAG: VOC family protein [Deltaproteobacteria bacterium]|nr:VOC family protein [Deltaproteobacteria bacterium]
MGNKLLFFRFAFVLVLIGKLLFGCEKDGTKNASDAGSATAANDATAASASGEVPDTTGSDGTTTAEGGNQSSLSAGNSGATAGTSGAYLGGNGGVAGAIAQDSGAASNGGIVATSDSGNTDSSESGATETSQDETPEPVATPYVWGVGIGVTDLPQATQFYTDVMKMTVEKEVMREDRAEVFLFASEANRGSRVVLMKYNDGRNTEKITSKLVFYALDVTGTVATASSAGYRTIFSMGVVAQIVGPSSYTHEILNLIGGPPAGTRITVPYLIAVGFSVSDFAASRRFYAEAFGMVESTPWSGAVTDATGAANIQEQTVEFSSQGGAGIVLQSWTPTRNSKDNPVKVVFFLPNALEYAEKIVAAGGSIVQEAERTDVYDNRILIVAADPDGYILELVQ